MGSDPWHKDHGPEWLQQANQAGRLEVCRGPADGKWLVRAYVPSLHVAEMVLLRWCQEYPDKIVALFRGGERVEAEQLKAKQLRREQAVREAGYFLALADKAWRQGKHGDARYYRRCAALFLDQAQAPPDVPAGTASP